MSWIAIAGGGTGGHLLPALEVAGALRALGWRVRFIGARRGMEAAWLADRGEEVVLVPAEPMQGSWGARLRALGVALPRAVWALWRRWRRTPPAAVLGVGGYASAAGVLAAGLLRIPVAIYEQNAVAGRTNRWLARWARCVFLGFAEAASSFPRTRAVHTGNPVRREIASVAYAPHEPPVLLVMGGSQGAHWLNAHMPQVCARLKRMGVAFSVWHLCGRFDAPEKVQADYAAAGVDARVDPFCEEMARFYAAGDLLVARAGAMTVSEAAAAGMPAVFVPLPHAACDHQAANARWLAERGAAFWVRQSEAAVERLSELCAELLRDPARRLEMSKRARALHAPEAAQKIAQELVAIAEEAR